jgi:sodium/bile acid cotransporter 7
MRSRTKTTLKRYWFLIALALVVPLGTALPEGGNALRGAKIVLPLLVAATLFVTGFTLNMSRLLRQVTNLRAILLVLSTTYILAPALAYALALLWGPAVGGAESRGFQFLQAVMIAAAQAGTLASAIALTLMARGDQELALVLTVVSNALTSLLTPLVLKFSVGAVVAFPLGDMMLRMTLVVVLPVILGQIARRLWWEAAAPVLPLLRRVPQIIILVFVYTGFSAAGGDLWREPTIALQFLGACASLHLLLLLWSGTSARILRLSPASRTAVLFCGAQKTLPNGIYLWDRFFPANPYGAIPLVLYHLFQLVVDTFLVPWVTPAESQRWRRS